MTTLSRAALYAQVWAEPMTQLAPKYGLTPATLKTICERYDVPTPRGGFWQRKSVGRAPPARALSDEAWSTEHEIDLSAPPPKTARPAPRVMTPRPSPIEALAAPKPKPAVQPRWTPVDDEAAAVRSLRKALDKAKATDLGFLHVHGRGLIPATLSDLTRERALAWLSRFLAAAAARGMELQTHDNAPCLVVDGQAIPFKLEEKSDKHAHTPTPAELRRKAEREEWSWGAHLADPWPKYDHYPSGRLSIQLEGNPYSGLRRSFADGKSRTLEALTEDVLDAVSAHAAYRTERDRQARITQRRAETERRRRAQREAFGAPPIAHEPFVSHRGYEPLAAVCRGPPSSLREDSAARQRGGSPTSRRNRGSDWWASCAMTEQAVDAVCAGSPRRHGSLRHDGGESLCAYHPEAVTLKFTSES